MARALMHCRRIQYKGGKGENQVIPLLEQDEKHGGSFQHPRDRLPQTGKQSKPPPSPGGG
ncbi:MAG: hypothetical protein JO089_03195 [Alphaproteobacteria bacterium]|nr:hypothetical protein [Alphaproteobacteria bacterium]